MPTENYGVRYRINLAQTQNVPGGRCGPTRRYLTSPLPQGDLVEGERNLAGYTQYCGFARRNKGHAAQIRRKYADATGSEGTEVVAGRHLGLL